MNEVNPFMNDFVKKMLDYNRAFVEHGLYEKYTTTKYPDRKIAILACMDTRMTELLPAALGLKNGDVKLIKNAGGRVMHPYGSVIFSLLVAVYELGVDTVVVIGHDDCGGRLLDPKEMIAKMKERGISQEAIDHVDENHKDVEQWLSGWGDIKDAVQGAVDACQRIWRCSASSWTPIRAQSAAFPRERNKKIKYEKSLFV
mgnify:CR=1 FL=1